MRERSDKIRQACETIGRDPIPFSLMTAVVSGMDDADLLARARRTAKFRDIDLEAVLSDPPNGWIVGTIEQVTEQLLELEEAGVSRVLCQLQPHDDLDFVELIGRELAPRLVS